MKFSFRIGILICGLCVFSQPTFAFDLKCFMLRLLGHSAPAVHPDEIPDTPQKINRLPDREMRAKLKSFRTVQAEAAKRYHFDNDSSLPRLKRLPKGIPEQYQPGFQRIFDLFMDHDLMFHRAQELEYEIYYRSLRDKIPFEDAYNRVLAEREAKHGFLPHISLNPEGTLSAQDFMTMLSGGALFLDPTFHDSGRVGVGGAAHGSTTHRVLQWHAIMRDMEENPDKYGNISEASVLFKALGDPAVVGTLDFRDSGISKASGFQNAFWRYLFDEPLERLEAGGFSLPSRFSPEGMRGIHARLPLLGPLLH